MVVFFILLTLAALSFWTYFGLGWGAGKYDMHGGLVIGVVFTLVLLTVCSIGSGINYDNASYARNSVGVYEAKERQRDELLAVFEPILDNQEYVALAEAVTPEEIKFLGRVPDITEFLLAKADRIADVNKALFKIENEILDRQRQLCQNVQNPFTPRWPFFGPDCNFSPLIGVDK